MSALFCATFKKEGLDSTLTTRCFVEMEVGGEGGLTEDTGRELEEDAIGSLNLKYICSCYVGTAIGIPRNSTYTTQICPYMESKHFQGFSVIFIEFHVNH